MAEIVKRNIRALLERQQQDQQGRGWCLRVADAIAGFVGSMISVYVHVIVFGLWIVINLGWLAFIQPFDPAFVALTILASIEAILLTTFVLIAQNRMQSVADLRSDLDLQISLLAEHEITRLVGLVCEIARRMGIEEAEHPELSELKRDVKPEQVLDEIEQNQERMTSRGN